jgi:hypothetical protein
MVPEYKLYHLINLQFMFTKAYQAKIERGGGGGGGMTYEKLKI